MIGGIIGLAVIIVLCLIIYHQGKKEEALLDVLENMNEVLIELDSRLRVLERQDFS